MARVAENFALFGVDFRGVNFLATVCDEKIFSELDSLGATIALKVVKLSKGIHMTEDKEAPNPVSDSYDRAATKSEQKEIIRDYLGEFESKTEDKKLRTALEVFSDALSDNSHQLHSMATLMASRIVPELHMYKGSLSW
jgi:hypothetical protein